MKSRQLIDAVIALIDSFARHARDTLFPAARRRATIWSEVVQVVYKQKKKKKRGR